jgi:hypothetical protein
VIRSGRRDVPARVGSGGDAPGSFQRVVDLITAVQRGELGPPPGDLAVPYAFTTLQRSRHPGWLSGYTNYVVHLRAGRTVGSCFFEPGQLEQATVEACVGQTLAQLLEHEDGSIRLAALDTYLGEHVPHARHPGARPFQVGAGTTVEKMRARAAGVMSLLDPQPGQTVAVIGVVNTLVAALRDRGVAYRLSDFNTQPSEWGDRVTPHMDEALDGADAILATGMTLSNGSFDRLLEHARERAIPLVVFAQSGSAVVPQFLGGGVTGVSAEPYPFLWVTGEPSTLYHYQ